MSIENDKTAKQTAHASNKTTLKDKVAYKPLTRKQEAFVQELLSDKKISATEAVRRTYNATTNHSAEVIAHENLRKPEIVSRLGQASDLVESALVNTVKEWSTSDKVNERSLAMDSAKFIHDKVHGKATQKIEQTSSVVRISINMNRKPTTD